MKILAHRGASADAPENTLSAFREAIAQGADGVELDVMVCGSGEVVVCHDERLDRLAGKDWELARTPYWLLRTADVGSPLGFGPERIPLLEEVLEVLPAHFLVNIELKCDDVEDRGLARKVGAMVTERALSERVVVSSFNALCLFRLAEDFPGLRRGYLIEPDWTFSARELLLAPLASNYSIHPPAARVLPGRVRRWHELGWQVATWTVDDPDEARRLADLGVDLCITNRPAALRTALSGPPAGP